MRTRGDQYQGKLKIGQKIHSILYGGRNGVITAIQGEQKPDTIRPVGGGIMVTGGSAMMTVTFDDYTMSRGLPESILRGVQWFIFDEIENYAEVLKAIERADDMKKGLEIVAAIKAEASAREREGLPTQYPNLTPVTQSGKSSIITAATNIRKELKAAYPHTKFTVVSRHGSSINIGWTDGPTSDDVNKIVSKYKEGTFDGMTDCYEYSRSNFSDIFGGARYVFCNRSESKETLIKVAAGYGWTLEFDKYNDITNLNWEDKQRVYREARGIAC